MNKQVYERYKKINKNQSVYQIDEKEFLDAAESDGVELRDVEEYSFQSRVDMEMPTDVWCEQFEDTPYNVMIYIYGIGHYKYLKKLVERVEYAAIVVYEPNIHNLVKFLKEDIGEILEKDDIIFITGKERQRYLSGTLDDFWYYNNRRCLYVANIPNYRKKYEEDYKVFSETLQNRYENMIFDKSTEIYHEKIQNCNYMRNIWALIHEAGVHELYEAVKGFIHYPAVIVSAGPSLDKNVSLLHEYKGRIFIVAVDAALNTLSKHDIVPDLIVTIDPKFEAIKALESDTYNRLPMLANLVSGYKLLRGHKGRKFFDVQGNNFFAHIETKYHINLPILATGGSVANSAFSFLESAGFRNIILIGQDLGYPDNRFHASDAFENEGELETTSDKYYYVGDIYGGKVLTEKNMDLYRLWFEDSIIGRDDLNVLDCTEGGALIHGTTIMPLKDALSQYCVLEEKNFVEIINGAEYLFDKWEQEEVQQYVAHMFTSMDEVIYKLKRGKYYYDELEELHRKGKDHSAKFANTMNKIRELTDFVDHDPQMALLNQYAVRERTEIIDRMNEATPSDEIRMLAETGRNLLDAYVLAGNRLKEDWADISKEQSMALGSEE